MIKKIALLSLLLAMFVLSPVQAESVPTATAYDFSFDGADGKPVKFSDYRGKVVLVVNTASECGLAGQFGDLQKLHDAYKDKGFSVLAVPSNDFGGQEPLEAAAVAEKTAKDYGVTYPFVAKARVSGDGAHPFYAWAAAQGKGAFLSDKPRWNFHKYLVGPNGELLGSYGPTTSPLDSDLIKSIETALLSAKVGE